MTPEFTPGQVVTYFRPHGSCQGLTAGRIPTPATVVRISDSGQRAWVKFKDRGADAVRMVSTEWIESVRVGGQA